MSELDTAMREQLLNEISNVFKDDNDPPSVFDDHSKRKRRYSIEEVVENDPFAGMEEGSGLLIEPKIELEEVEVEPVLDQELAFRLEVANTQLDTQNGSYIEDFHNQDYVELSPAFYYGSSYVDVAAQGPGTRPETFMCTVCNSVFTEQKRLRLHMRRQHDMLKHTFKYNCDLCGESYDHRNSLSVHIKRKHRTKQVAPDEDKTEVTCDICGSVLVGKRRLRFHLQRKHSLQDKPFRYKCGRCPNTYDKALSLEIHRKRKHSSYRKKRLDNLQCPVCPKRFTNRASYMAHLRRTHQSRDGSKVQIAGMSDESSVNAAFADVPIMHCEGNNELACSQCPLLFADINRLRLHMKRVHNANAESFQYKCTFCSLTYDKRASLIRHVTRKHNKELYCETCKKQFTSHEMYLNHSHANASVEEQTPVYQCGICKMIYIREGTLAKHMRLAHNVETSDMTVFCDVCGKGFFQQKYLNSHLKKVHSDLSYMCQFCQKVFTLKGTLRQHIFRHHLRDVKQTDTSTFACLRCSQPFTNEQELCNHIATAHTNEAATTLKTEIKYESENIEREEYTHGDLKDGIKEEAMKDELKSKNNTHLQCTECDERFEAWDKLRYHFKMKHLKEESGIQKVVCQHCGLVTTTPLLTRHLVIAHKDVIEVFRCGKCNYKTAKRELLVKHEQCHTMEKKYSCPVKGCSYKTHNKHKLRPHSAKHAVKVKLHCTKCEFVTNDPHIMKNHENEHQTGRKRYACDQCDYATNLPSNIINHRFKHSDERNFKCNQCPFDTKYSTALWLHKRQKHSDKPPLQIGKRKSVKVEENAVSSTVGDNIETIES